VHGPGRQQRQEQRQEQQQRQRLHSGAAPPHSAAAPPWRRPPGGWCLLQRRAGLTAPGLPRAPLQALRCMAERYAAFAGSEAERLTPLVETLSERWAPRPRWPGRPVRARVCCPPPPPPPQRGVLLLAGHPAPWHGGRSLSRRAPSRARPAPPDQPPHAAAGGPPWPSPASKPPCPPPPPRACTPCTRPPCTRPRPVQVPGREVQRRPHAARRGARLADPGAGGPPLPAVHVQHGHPAARGAPPQARRAPAAGPLPQGGLPGGRGAPLRPWGLGPSGAPALPPRRRVQRAAGQQGAGGCAWQPLAGSGVAPLCACADVRPSAPSAPPSPPLPPPSQLSTPHPLLQSIGVPLDEALKFWRQEFAPRVAGDKFEKECAAAAGAPAPAPPAQPAREPSAMGAAGRAALRPRAYLGADQGA
jgi:hypothetical protein